MKNMFIFASVALGLAFLSVSPATAGCGGYFTKSVYYTKHVHYFYHPRHCCCCHYSYLPSITYGLVSLPPNYYYSQRTIIASVLTNTSTIILPKD